MAAVGDERATIDHDRLAGGEATGVTRQVERGGGNLIGRACTAERGEAEAAFGAVRAGQDRARPFGFDEAGRDGVGADAGRTPFHREIAG
ncbi:hypothetical protein J2W40_002375 [Sphingobium xenophagum]|uniref:Uncharacterized protein n=1 Tax=Sphingobium xenophagum TaxID=121428 RepID=A0ABU1X1S4_SPHXE|nr:hypothetical protein [Sphingobium xenophagum]